MRILALDTSTEYLSLALMLDGKVLSEDMHAGQTHSQLILPLIGEMLSNAGLQLRELDGIAFGAGPGSFTGLRIGCGVAQGLAFGASLPVAGISTLLALAHSSEADKVIACLDARMGEVYHAAYAKSGAGWQEASPPGLYKPEEVPLLTGEGWTGAGSGWSAYGNILNKVYTGLMSNTLPVAYPRATSIAALAEPIFEAGLGVPAAQAAPIYIRNKVALTMNERENR
ncbi:MAG TPA: tRNA (adenosine(37)-N6)-threonylcarbamoyltransferase complex dimerization subunit type 1 TsaB [Methylophilaceae bacterium]|nr:tRNA (adenosine(37)-N6)-threonylcarbamoyltransferase complex dimerization subunit type 1 TsaB [Methylophilaceae bacterium]